MQNLRFAIAAGETKIFEIAGRYLEIIESAGPLTIELFDANGGQSDEARDVLSGTYMTEPYARTSIYSATAQTVELFMSARGGGTRRQPGVVSVTNKIASSSSIAGTGGLTAIGFSANQLIAPAANTRGAIIRGASAGCATSAIGASNYAKLQMIAAPSVPGALSPPVGLILADQFNPTTDYKENANWDKNITIPAGWGVWMLSANAGVVASSGGGALCFELL